MWVDKTSNVNSDHLTQVEYKNESSVFKLVDY